jgi:hypothetical protein
MLFAMLLIGLLPAAFMFDGNGAPEGAEDVDPPEMDRGGPAPAGDVGLLPDLDEAPEPDADAEAEPASLEVPAGEDEASIDGFRPGTDRLTLHLRSADATLSSLNFQ